MIVQCPECRARYRIRDSNVPASGGKIRCPSCSHSFIVYPEEVANDPTIEMSKVDKTAIASDSAMRDLVSTMQTPKPAATWEDEGPPTQIVGAASLQNIAGEAKGGAGGDVAYHNNWGGGSSDLEEDSEDDLDGMTQVVMPNVALPTGTPGSPAEKSVPTLFGTGSFPQAAASAPTRGSDQNYGSNSWSHEESPQAQPLKSAPATLFGPAAIQIQQDRQLDSASFPQAAPPEVPRSVDSEEFPGAGMISNSGYGPGSAESIVPPPLPGHSPPADSDYAQPAAADPDTLDEGPGRDHDGPWKLQTNFGLAYEFPDTEGLRNWLSSREELDGYALSDDDGQNYYPLIHFPQLSERRPTPTAVRAIDVGALESSESQAGVSRFATSAIGLPKITANVYQPPSREEESNKFLILVLFVLVGVAVPLVMNAAKLDEQLLGLNLKEAIFGASENSPVKLSAVANKTEKQAPEVAVDVAALKRSEVEQQADIDRTFKDARRLIKNKRLTSAIKKLEIVLALDPSRKDARELAADLYEKLGQSEKAETVRNFGAQQSADAGTDQDSPAEKPD